MCIRDRRKPSQEGAAAHSLLSPERHSAFTEVHWLRPADHSVQPPLPPAAKLRGDRPKPAVSTTKGLLLTVSVPPHQASENIYFSGISPQAPLSGDTCPQSPLLGGGCNPRVSELLLAGISLRPSPWKVTAARTFQERRPLHPLTERALWRSTHTRLPGRCHHPLAAENSAVHFARNYPGSRQAPLPRSCSSGVSPPPGTG